MNINSIQTARDCLIADGTEFDIGEMKDCVQLYHNPAQTNDKVKLLMLRLKNGHSLDSFWVGTLSESKPNTAFSPHAQQSPLDKAPTSYIIH